jgi:23S rRNA (uracil1939-C5)-methyltransferase
VRPPREVVVDGFTADGLGTGLDPRGIRWNLPGAAPGSRVLAAGRPKHGRVLDLLNPAPTAIPPRCPVFHACGGCSWQHVPLVDQRLHKAGALATLLAPLGGTDHGFLGPSFGEDAAYGWRDKIELTFGAMRWLSEAEARACREERRDPADAARGRFLGFHAQGRFDRIVDIAACPVARAGVNAVLARARAALLASPFDVHDPYTHEGMLRHLVIRATERAGGGEGAIASLYTRNGTEALAAFLRASAPAWGADAVLWFDGDGIADAATGTLREVVHGDPRLRLSLGGARFELAPTAFFQGNRAGAEVLLAGIAGALGAPAPGTTLVDLYCGVGAISLALGPRYARIVGIEEHEAAVEDARANAARLGRSATYIAAKVEDALAATPLGAPLHAVVDPPRAGCHPRALDAIARLPAEVLVYVACKPSSLLRDGLRLQERGWSCTDRWLVDLFPGSRHVEALARFVRAFETGIG